MRGTLFYERYVQAFDLPVIPRKDEAVLLNWEEAGRSVFRVEDVLHDFNTGLVRVILR